MKKFLIFIFISLISSLGFISSQQKVWTLEECIKYAVDNNIQIKQQVVQTEIQKNSLDLSKFKLLPSLNGNISHDYSFGRALDQNTYQFYNQTLQSDYFNVGGNMPVFSGLQNYNSIQKNKYTVLSGKQELQSVTDNVMLNVALTYLQILLNKELVAANENQLNITLQQIEKTKKLVSAGSVPKGNLLQIQAQAAQEEFQLINTKNQLVSSYLTITQLLELITPAGFEIETPDLSVDTNSVISGNIEEIYKFAMGSRPEIIGSELRLKSSEYDLKIAKGGRSPRVALNYSMNTRYSYINSLNNDPFNTQLKNNRNSGIGLSMSIPILNGWQINKNISNSKLNIETNNYNLEGEKKALYKNIQTAYNDAVAALKKFTVSIKAVMSSEESFRYTEQKFNVGLVTPVDYNVAKTQLIRAQSDMSQSKFEYIFKTQVLNFYKGIPITLTRN